MKTLVIIFFILISSRAAALLQFTPLCARAYNKTMELDFRAAANLLQKEKSSHPDNLIPDYILNYSSFLNVLINEAEGKYDDFIDNTENLIDKFNNEPSSSPFKYYCLTDLYLQIAYIDALDESYFAAAVKLRKARSSILKNKELFPSFLPNKKALGLMSVALGSVPKNYGWIMDIFGLEGSVTDGLQMLKSLTETALDTPDFSWLKTEAVLGYTFSAMNFGDFDKKQNFLQMVISKLSKDSSLFNNQLLAYSAASYFRHIGDNESVIKTLESVVSQDKQRFYYLDFLLGSAYLYKIDPLSVADLLNYLRKFPGNAYRKSALQRIAWFKLIEGDKKGYEAYMNLVKERGNSFYDSDKKAMKDALSENTPNKYLLKCRLLFDGGYYKEAARVFVLNNPVVVLKNGRDRLEYSYRMGRIYDEWGKTEKALEYYRRTVEQGRNFPYYYAANASLHLGYIYERQGNFAKAKESYKLCLNLDFDEYRNSITQKAKAGLNRIEKK